MTVQKLTLFVGVVMTVMGPSHSNAARPLQDKQEGLVAASDEGKAKVLFGKWEVAFTQWYGKKSETKNRIIWEFQPRNKVILRHIPPPGDKNGKPYRSEGTYKLDTNVVPWHIDVEMMEDRMEMGGDGPKKGIITVKKDILLFCITGTIVAPRPTKMASEKESYNIFRRMRRVRSTSKPEPKTDSD